MNFGKLGRVETADEYLDIAFRQSKVKALLAMRSIKGGNFARLQSKELASINYVATILKGHLTTILTSFPILDKLDPFYRELVKTVVDVPQVKQSLGGINWGIQRIRLLFEEFHKKFKSSRTTTELLNHKRAYYGRISSVVKQLKKDFVFLEDARKKLRVLPSFKTSVPTIVIAGFPNVGKTTLLKALTGSAPEIQSYPFTTKSLMLGYRKHGKDSWQIIDTPGLLDRSLVLRNKIEKQAALALKHLAKAVIFVIDPSESCGYPLPEQKNLLKEVAKSLQVPVVVALNKIDLSPLDKIDEAKKNTQRVVLISAEKGKGIKELVAEVGKVL